MSLLPLAGAPEEGSCLPASQTSFHLSETYNLPCSCGGSDLRGVRNNDAWGRLSRGVGALADRVFGAGDTTDCRLIICICRAAFRACDGAFGNRNNIDAEIHKHTSPATHGDAG